MPRIKDIKPYIFDILGEFKKTAGIRDLYVWGSYAKNMDNISYRVKDIDILAKTKFNSGDLISVGENIIKDLCSDSYLEKQGYDPSTVKFSKAFLNLEKYNVDCWVISCDRKLLHWGPIITDKRETKDINKEAEEYASNISGKTFKKVNKSSEKIRENWYNHYCSYIDRCFEDQPTGWYKTENSIKVKEILSEAIKI